MFIFWYGLTCFKIQEKDTTILIDPFAKETGLTPPRQNNAQIITLSSQDLAKNVRTANEGVIVLDNPGEYEASKIYMSGVASSYSAKTGSNIIFTYKISDMNVCHLGKLSGELSEEAMDIIDGVDILLIPIGGGETLDANQASKIINEIEPRIVIPMYYQIPKLKTKLDGLDKFCKEMGIKKTTGEAKLTIKKNLLPQDETKVVILQNNNG